MSFESPRKPVGDALLRDLERKALAKLDDVPTQQAYLAELGRKGRASDEPAQQRLFAALLQRDGEEAAVEQMNEFLDQFKMRGAVVNVESPAGQAGQGAEQAPAPERRWVSWKRVWREQTPDEQEKSKKEGKDPREQVEIPGSIEKILVVTLRDGSFFELIEDGNYGEVDDDISNEPVPMNDVAGRKELVVPEFRHTVTTTEIDQWLSANELGGCTFKELLAIGSQFPEEQRFRALAALDKSDGSWRSRGRVPVLYRFDFVRTLDLNNGGDLWHGGGRFPASRKPVAR